MPYMSKLSGSLLPMVLVAAPLALVRAQDSGRSASVEADQGVEERIGKGVWRQGREPARISSS
jgi:hypothetical protein